MTSSKRRVSIAYFCYLRTVPPNRDVFCKGYDYGEKVVVKWARMAQMEAPDWPRAIT